MADPTDPLSYINPFSRCVVHLTMDFEGIELATGTGFLRRRGGELFLITAWHNLTGREPATLKPKHSQGSLPNYVRIEGYFFARRLALYFDNNPNDEEHCSRCFWQHPHGPDIDVAVLRVPSSSQEEGWPIDETFFDISAGKQKERWIRFQGSVNAKSAEALMRAVDDCYAERITHVHLMMSSLGGDVFWEPPSFHSFGGFQ